MAPKNVFTDDTTRTRGFAKSRPAAQRPAAHGPPRPSGPAARRPSGPRPTARDGPAARRPGGPEAHTVLLSSGKSTRMAQICISLNSFTILIIISILFDPFFRCMLLSEKRCHSLLFSSVYNNKQKQGFK